MPESVAGQAVCFHAYGAVVSDDPVKGFRRVRFYVDGKRALEVRMSEGLAGALLGKEPA